MLQTFNASFDAKGKIHLPHHVHPINCNALVTILPSSRAMEEDLMFSSALLTESALQEWNTEMEESAWAHLQPKTSS